MTETLARGRKVIELIARGGTEGEKAAARVALGRIIASAEGEEAWIVGGEAMLRTQALTGVEREFVGRFIERKRVGAKVSRKQQEWFGRIYKRVIGWRR